MGLTMMFSIFGGNLDPNIVLQLSEVPEIGGRDHVITPHVNKNTGTCHVSGKTLLLPSG